MGVCEIPDYQARYAAPKPQEKLMRMGYVC